MASADNIISPPTDNGNEVSLPMFDSPPTTPALGTPSVESDAEDNYQYASSRHGFAFPTTPDGSTTSFPSLSPAGPITSKPRAPYRNLSGSFMNDTPDQLGRPNPFIEQVELHHQQTAEQQRRIMDWDELDRAKRATPVSSLSHPHRIHRPFLLSSKIARHAKLISYLVLLVILTSVGIYSVQQDPIDVAPPPARVTQHPHAAPQVPSVQSKPRMRDLPVEEPWTWRENQELAAVIGFITSGSQHALPAGSAKSLVTPELVLDFDPAKSLDLKQDMADMVQGVWSGNVAVLLGKGHGDPITRDLRAALKSMRISPEPAYIEVDARPDVEILLPVLARLFGVEDSEDSFPILLIGGQQVKVSKPAEREETVAYLKPLVLAAGGRMIPPKMKKRPVPVKKEE